MGGDLRPRSGSWLGLRVGTVNRSSGGLSMCQCSMPTTEGAKSGARMSVHAQGEQEAKRYKWIESEKAGRDLGEWAIRCWVREHWNGFLRARWLEHLQGRTFWIELDHNDFGLLQREFRDSRLIDEILSRLKGGQEN